MGFALAAPAQSSPSFGPGECVIMCKKESGKYDYSIVKKSSLEDKKSNFNQLVKIKCPAQQTCSYCQATCFPTDEPKRKTESQGKVLFFG